MSIQFTAEADDESPAHLIRSCWTLAGIAHVEKRMGHDYATAVKGGKRVCLTCGVVPWPCEPVQKAVMNWVGDAWAQWNLWSDEEKQDWVDSVMPPSDMYPDVFPEEHSGEFGI